MLSKQKFISIIVPVYNCEKYLSQCLQSLISQTYPNIEIICVDDGSTDSSIQIMQKFALMDSRIHIVEKTNNGVSAARNTGIEIATGDYILFVDSDDWLDETTCEQTLEVIERENTDVVIFPYIREGNEKAEKKIIFPESQYLEADALKTIHRRFFGAMGKELRTPENSDSLCTVWGKLYRRDIIIENGIKFTDLQTIGTYEDGLFNIVYFSIIHSGYYHNRYLYHYRKTNETSITSRYKELLFEQWCNLFEILRVEIEENNYDKAYKVALNNRIAMSVLGLGLNIMEKECSPSEKKRMIKRILIDERYIHAYEGIDFSDFSAHWRIFYSFAKWKFEGGVYLILRIIKFIRTY